MHHVTRVLHALVPYVPPALLTFWFTFLVSYVPRAKHTIVFHVSYVLLHLTCFLFCVFSECLCLELYLLLGSSSLTCFRCFNLNMLWCISCFVAFMVRASCTFFPLAIWVFEKKNWEHFTSFLRANLIILIDSNKSTLDIFFFYQDFLSRTLTTHRTAGEGRGPFFISTNSTRSPTFKHLFATFMWDDYHIFTKLLLDEILPPYRITVWLIDAVKFVLVYLLNDLILGFCDSNLDTGNQWTRARIDYHPCATSEPTNQVC